MLSLSFFLYLSLSLSRTLIPARRPLTTRVLTRPLPGLERRGSTHTKRDSPRDVYSCPVPYSEMNASVLGTQIGAVPYTTNEQKDTLATTNSFLALDQFRGFSRSASPFQSQRIVLGSLSTRLRGRFASSGELGSSAGCSLCESESSSSSDRTLGEEFDDRIRSVAKVSAAVISSGYRNL